MGFIRFGSAPRKEGHTEKRKGQMTSRQFNKQRRQPGRVEAIRSTMMTMTMTMTM